MATKKRHLRFLVILSLLIGYHDFIHKTSRVRNPHWVPKKKWPSMKITGWPFRWKSLVSEGRAPPLNTLLPPYIYIFVYIYIYICIYIYVYIYIWVLCCSNFDVLWCLIGLLFVDTLIFVYGNVRIFEISSMMPRCFQLAMLNYESVSIKQAVAETGCGCHRTWPFALMICIGKSSK